MPAVAGTDAAPDNPHGGVAREVAFMVDAGLPVLAAVRAATAEAADLPGVPDRALRQGAAADVLVADGDVAADITALGKAPGGVPGRPPGGLGWTRCL